MLRIQKAFLFTLVIFIGSLALSSAVRAQDYVNANDLCKPESRILWVLNLINNGITQVGDLNLVQLKNEMEKLNCIVNVGPIVKSADGLRLSAINFPSSRKMIFNVPQERHRELRHDALVLHEAFGALGFNDANYQLSAAIQSLDMRVYNQKLILNKDPRQLLIGEDLKNSIQRLIQSPIFKNRILLAGGADAGGGDFSAAENKVEMLSEVDSASVIDKAMGREPKVVYAELESFILMINIEVEHGNLDESSMHLEKTDRGYILYIPDTTYVLYKGIRRLPSYNGVKLIQDYLEVLAITSSQ